MFHAAEAVLASKGLKFKTHRAVLSGFGRFLIQTGEFPADTHRWFLDAYDLRQLGDYQPLSTISEDRIADMQLKAAAFVEQAEGWLGRQA
jgi:uncharacterized protein (UPF0332 family)